MKYFQFGSLFLLAVLGCDDPAAKLATTASGSAAGTNAKAAPATTPAAIKDPDGSYALFSDPRIKKAPAAASLHRGVRERDGHRIL